jgi:methyl coenzyme M reductase gamma subunit
MSLYNEAIREGRSKLHPWQIEAHLRFALPQAQFDYTTMVNRMNIVAANGSGKSSKVVAPCLVWNAMANENSSSVVTSASGVQLDRQTGAAIKHLCHQVNRIHGRELWDIKYREYTFRPDQSSDAQSKIFMYATDEPGKAEGYHPLVDGGRFAYVADEAKTIMDEIFQGIERCNGKSNWLNVSSPGQPLGFFYNACCSARWWTRKVTAYECPHIKQDEIDSAKEQFGEASPLFRSAYLAEFTSINESCVIPFERILRQQREPPPKINDGIRRAGVDLSAGGDEQVVVIMDGNEQIGLEVFRFNDHRQITEKLLAIFRKWNLKGEEINVDDGYTGRAVIDYLKNDGFHVVPVQFGGSAYNKIAYGNRGTEIWVNYERHLQYLRLLNDQLMIKQLASRYYKRSDTTGKVILESKREAKANGHGSPDRGDAAVLALARVPIGYFSSPTVSVELSDDEQAAELIRQIATGKSANLTEDQVTKVTLAYRALRHAFKASKDAEKTNDKMYSDRNHLDCHDYVEISNKEKDTSPTFKLQKAQEKRTYGE